MFNVTLGIYENMRPHSDPVSRAVAEKPLAAQDFQSILNTVESHRDPKQARQVASPTVKTPVPEPLKKMPAVAQHQYEPLPEAAENLAESHSRLFRSGLFLRNLKYQRRAHKT